MNWLIVHVFGIGKLTCMATVNKDTLTTYLGFAQGLIAVGLDWLHGGVDLTEPESWLALGFAVMTYVKGWATNKGG